MDKLNNKNSSLIIAIAILVLVIASAAIMLLNRNSLKQTKDSYTHEAGQELQLDAAEFFDADEKKAAQVAFDLSAVDVNTVGEYTAVAEFKGKSFEIKVTVVDTTAPMAEFSDRCIFTNDITNTSFENTFAGVYDASEWTAKLIRFEYAGNLQVMDETAVKSLTDTIPLPCDAEELQNIGTTDTPTEEGIYRAVLEIGDVHGNSILEEVYVVYDTTGARIDDVPDKVVRVPQEDLDKEPAVDKNDYTITDNVDGAIDAEDIKCELELRDEEKREWLAHVSHTDRAGNESKAEFLITLKEESSTTAGNEDGDNAPSGNGGAASDNGNANNAGSGNGENYDPADTNKDGVVDSDEAIANISPSEQAMINAGYGNVVQLPTGNYGLLMPDPDYLINGKRGNEILREYLASIGLEGSIGGGWMNDQYYNFIAENVHQLITSDDEEFWD